MTILRLCALAVLVLTGAGKVVMEPDGAILTNAATISGDGAMVPMAPAWSFDAG